MLLLFPTVRTILIVALLCLASGAVAAWQCTLVEDGAPQGILVYQRIPSAELAEAIEDFRNHIHRMSGAVLQLETEPKGGLDTLILCLASALEPAKEAWPGTLSSGSIEALKSLNEEGFILRVDSGLAVLYGRSELALQHGLYWLLEQWGCRWLFPGEAGEVVPSVTSLEIGESLETEQQPRFLMRDIWYNWGGWLPESVREDRLVWMRRNRLNHSLRGTIGHAYRYIVPHGDEELFEDHPEYYPVKNGEPIRAGQICTCNPGVRERAVRYALSYFEKHPEATLVSLSPNDGGGPWRCPDNREHAFFTDAALCLANHVADALAANPKTRDKKVAMYAYFITARPPSFSASENVVIFLATRFNYFPWPWLACLWDKKTSHLGIRDYASILPWHWSKPVWRLSLVKRKVRIWDKREVIGVSIESGNDWGGWGLYHYVMGRLLWDPQEEVSEIVEDFLDRGFGPAAPIMAKYFRRWEWGYTPQSWAFAVRDLDRALDIGTQLDIRWRIEQYVLYLHYLRLLRDYRSAPSGESRLEAARSLVSFGWRLAPTNMAHSLPLIDNYLKRELQQKMGIDEGKLESWKEDAPFTSAEIERILLEDLTRARSYLESTGSYTP